MNTELENARHRLMTYSGVYETFDCHLCPEQGQGFVIFSQYVDWANHMIEDHGYRLEVAPVTS